MRVLLDDNWILPIPGSACSGNRNRYELPRGTCNQNALAISARAFAVRLAYP
jgi:hypothetical protein